MDINEIISSLSADDIEKLKGVADSIMGSGGGDNSDNQKQLDLGGISPEMLKGISQLGKVFSNDDERTALIKALKPMLSDERRQRADEAIKILRLMQLLPLLRESGILKGLI